MGVNLQTGTALNKMDAKFIASSEGLRTTISIMNLVT